MDRRGALRVLSSRLDVGCTSPVIVQEAACWVAGLPHIQQTCNVADTADTAVNAVVQGHGEALLQPWPATAKYSQGAQPALSHVNPWT